MVEILDRLIALHQMVPLVLMLNFLSFLETGAKNRTGPKLAHY